MNVIYGSSNEYAPYCGISVLSLFENNKDSEKIDVYIVDDNISEENKSKFYEIEQQYNRKITFLDRSKEIEELKKLTPGADHKGSNYQLLRVTPNIFPDVNRILSLGSDTIINGSIKEMYNTDMSNHVIAIVINPNYYLWFMYNFASYNFIAKKNKRIPIGDMCLFNMDLWNKKDYYDKIMQSMHDYEELKWDEFVLGFVVEQNDILPLHPKYNYIWFHKKKKYRYKLLSRIGLYTRTQIDEAHDNPVIIHYGGGYSRPWLDGSMCPKQYRDIFMYYKEISPWRDVPNEPFEEYPLKSVPFRKVLNKFMRTAIHHAPFWMYNVGIMDLRHIKRYNLHYRKKK